MGAVTGEVLEIEIQELLDEIKERSYPLPSTTLDSRQEYLNYLRVYIREINAAEERARRGIRPFRMVEFDTCRNGDEHQCTICGNAIVEGDHMTNYCRRHYLHAFCVLHTVCMKSNVSIYKGCPICRFGREIVGNYWSWCSKPYLELEEDEDEDDEL